LKLVAGNPNLMKVNKSVGLGTFAQTAGDLGQVKVRRGYVPTERDPSLVPAPTSSIWKRESYVPQNLTPMRPGADDHLKFKSVGNLT
jgi:hypothetical protein